MKKIKSLLLVVMLMVVSAFTLSACGNTDSPKASFSQSEFILSRGEVIDFFEYLSFENVQQGDVTLQFTNEELLNVNDEGKYKAQQSGQTMLKVMYQNDILTSCNVIVKQQFSKPTGIKVDEAGQVSWENSFAYAHDKMVVASVYNVKVNDVLQVVQGNSFTLTEKGEYLIEIQAQGIEKIDSSEFSSDNVRYGVMEEVEVTQFDVVSDFGSCKVKLGWNLAFSNAYFNVYLDGFKMESEIRQSEATLDFLNFFDGQNIDVIIEAVDRTGNLLPSRRTISVQKLAKPSFNYSFVGGQGKVVWNDNENATGYVLQCVDRSNPSKVDILFVEAGKLESTLEGLNGGVYSISVQAVGGKNENGYFVSSNFDSREFAKISTPEILHSVTAGQLRIEFDQNEEYVEKYLIEYGNYSYVWDTKSMGYVASINISTFERGAYEVFVTGLPKTNASGDVVEIKEGIFSTANVVNANVEKIDVYILADIEDFKHEIVEGQSKVSFKEVEYATNYTIILGEKLYSVYDIVDGNVVFNLGDLKEVAPVDNGYTLQINAFRTDNSSINSSLDRKLTILGLASEGDKDKQENGYYTWKALANVLAENVKYRYEIFEVDKDFNTGDEITSSPIMASAEPISETKTTDALGYGYYCIRIYTISANQSEYLDSDFYNANGYFEVKFHVEEQIKTPEYTFGTNDDNGKYSLSIVKVAFAEKYEIAVYLGETCVYTDTAYDFNPSETILIQDLNYNFDEAGNYKIVVTACADDVDVDSTLHTSSEGSLINVSKLAAPTFTVDEKQLLTVDMIDNAESVVIKQGENILNTNKENSVSLIDFNATFGFVMKFIASEKDGNNYYLDSNEIQYSFKRSSAPTDIAFSDGILSFVCEDGEYIEKYIVTVTLVTSGNNNYETTIEINTIQYNFQEYIQAKILDDNRFASAYRQCNRIEVKVSAYKNGFVEIGDGEVYFLPSRDGTTTTGADRLTLTQLESPAITFDTEILTLSWNSVGEIGQTTYSIYIDGEKREETPASSILLENVDFSTAKSIVVFANNPAYLSSIYSNEISVVKLSKVSRIGVLSESGSVYLTLPSNELSHVKEVLCNDTSVSFNVSNGYLSLNLSDFDLDGVATLTFKIVAGSSHTTAGVTHYYLNSLETSYELASISDTEITLDIEDGVLSWNDIATDFAGISERPLVYNLIINRNGELAQRVNNIKDNKYQLNSEILYGLNIGQYQLYIEAVISDYYLDFVSPNSKGYYGKRDSNILDVKKLNSIQDITFASIEDTSITKETERKAAAKVELSWSDIWTDSKGVSFNIIVNGEELGNVETTTASQNYSLSLSDGVYKLLLNGAYFNAGSNNVKVSVNADASITSNVYSYDIVRYDAVSNLVVSDDGKLTITADENIDSFFVVALNGNDIYSEAYKANAENVFDIISLLEKVSGNYTVEVVGFDSNGKCIPSVRVTTVTGYRLNGLSEVKITEKGEVNITLYNEREIDDKITFVAKYKDVTMEFKPTRNGETSTFVYSMLDFINLFNITTEGRVDIEVSVQKTGNINANWLGLTFNYVFEKSGDTTYARGKNYADDYLIFNDLEGTTAFRFEIHYTATEDKVQLSMVQTYLAKELTGYWITTADGEEYFAKELPTVSSDLPAYESTSLYGISLNTLLSKIEGSEITIKVSRVRAVEEETEEVYYQYNIVEFNCNKLYTVTGVRVSDDRVTWNASSEPDTSYYVYFYIQDGTELSLSSFRHVTSAFIDVYNLLTPGTRYYINIVTVSPLLYRIASNPTSNIEALKYKEPSPLEVKNGKLMFSESAVVNSDLFKTISENYNLTGGTEVTPDYVIRNVASASFSDIFTFTPAQTTLMTIELNFTSMTSGRNYVVSLNAADLMPDISQFNFETIQSTHIDYLQALYNLIAQVQDQTTYRRDVLAMYNAFKDANGVADYEMLFDEFGAQIPAGKYMVSIRQLGNNSIGTITSNSSSAVEVNVAAAPNISLDCKTINNKNHYEISFPLTNIADALSKEPITAQTYIMYMVSETDGNKYYFTIVNNGTEENPLYQIINVMVPVSDVNIRDGKLYYQTTNFDSPITLTYSNGFVTLDLTDGLLPAMPNIVRDTYNFTIIAQGNSYTINSKTDMVKLTLLGIDYTQISLNSGVLTWKASGSDNFKTRVTYKRENEGADYIDIPFVRGQATLDFNKEGEEEISTAGKYDYIILRILGGVGQGTMTVDSESYLIENLYKLIEPTISARGNALNLANQSRNKNFYEFAQFEITNDIAKANSTITPYLTNAMTDNNYTYYAGLQGIDRNNQNYNYKVTEQNASEYFVLSKGNTKDFKQSVSQRPVENDEKYGKYYGLTDFVLSLGDDGYCILNSDEVSIKASMLKGVTDFKIEDGDLVWTSEEEEKQLPANAVKVYQLSVIYYKGDEQNFVGETAVYYTTSTRFDTVNIERRDNDEYYIFELKALGFINGRSTDYDIKTIEGEYYKLSNIEYVDGGYVLGSDLSTLGTHSQKIVKTKAITNPTIFGGQFTWPLDISSENEVYPNLESVVIDRNNKIVDGKMVKEIRNGSEIVWSFYPNVEFENNPHEFKIYTYMPSRYTGDWLKSDTAVVKQGASANTDVYMLPTVTSEDFSVREIVGGYEINLEKLYETKQIFGSSSNYRVIMYVEVGIPNGDIVELEANSWNNDSFRNTNFNFAIGSEEVEVNGNVVNIPKDFTSLAIKFHVVDNQQTQSVMLLNGHESEWFGLTPLSWEEDTVLSWNSDLAQFEWNYEKEGVENPIYLIELDYLDGSTETAEISTQYYQPRRIGEIISAKLYVRKDSNSIYSSAITCEGVSEINPIRFRLFNGGDGSVTNPYQISNSSEFYNMKYRNSASEKFYFIQISDLTLSATRENDGFVFNGTFNGAYNGNGRTITFISKANEIFQSGEDDKEWSSLSQALFAGNNITTINFENISSIFKELGEVAEITNLKLALNFERLAYRNVEDERNTLFTGLAITNYGRIENVEILSVDTAYAIGQKTNISIGQAGLVAVNYGRITDCINSADISLVASARYSYSFVVSGLVFTNLTSGNNFTGTLTRCFNNGNISASSSRPNSIIWISGLLLDNSGGRVVECGNNGALSGLGSSGYTSYITGVTMRSVNGEINFSFNNGEITSTANSSYSSGVAYSISGGRINTLVDTSGNYIARVCTNNVRNNGASYCDPSNLTSGIDTLALGVASIPCGDSYTLTILMDGDKYKANIL